MLRVTSVSRCTTMWTRFSGPTPVRRQNSRPYRLGSESRPSTSDSMSVELRGASIAILSPFAGMDFSVGTARFQPGIQRMRIRTRLGMRGWSDALGFECQPLSTSRSAGRGASVRRGLGGRATSDGGFDFFRSFDGVSAQNASPLASDFKSWRGGSLRQRPRSGGWTGDLEMVTFSSRCCNSA